MDNQMDNSPDSRGGYIEELEGGAVIPEVNPALSKNDCTVLVKKEDFLGLPSPQNYHILPFPPEMQSVIIGCRGDGRDQSGKTSVKNVLSLPSKYSIPGGLAQVFVGGSMVICGAFALRYQNYFFYYGSGLWAGTLAGISGIVNLMATRKGLKHPRWLCGGFRRRIAIFLTAIVMSLLTSVAAAILSTSGLIQDSQYDYSKQPVETSLESEIYETRKSSGILINALLLLLSLLQILLTFGSLGIALRVYFANRYGNLLQSGSDKSEVTEREVIGNGEGHEYEAKKDRLLCWLGHQRPQFFNPHSKPKRATTFREVTGQPPMRVHRSASARVPAPVLVAVLPPPHCQTAVLPQPQSMPFLIPAGSLPRAFPPFSIPQYVFPQPMMVPLATLPRSRQPRSITPVSLPAGGNGKGYRRKYRRDRDLQRDMTDDQQTKSSSSVRSDPVPEEPEITEEEVGKTYTGLDRVIAEEFISSTMSRH